MLTLLEFVKNHLPDKFIDKEKSNEYIIFIKPEYQILADEVYLRSQSFIQKAPVKILAQGKPIPEEQKCKIEYFVLKNNNSVWIGDTTNQRSPEVHVDNLNNYMNEKRNN